MPSTDEAVAATERKRIEDAIEKLQATIAGSCSATVEAAETQKTLINNLTQLPTRPAPANGAAPAQPDWAQLFAMIGQRIAEAQKIILDTQIKIREVDLQIRDLEGKLTQLAPTQQERTEVKVFVNAGAPLEADMVIRYQVTSASWTPFYDARLATGTKAQAPKLQLVRRASIQQRSGEIWDNVAPVAVDGAAGGRHRCSSARHADGRLRGRRHRAPARAGAHGHDAQRRRGTRGSQRR